MLNVTCRNKEFIFSLSLYVILDKVYLFFVKIPLLASISCKSYNIECNELAFTVHQLFYFSLYVILDRVRPIYLLKLLYQLLYHVNLITHQDIFMRAEIAGRHVLGLLLKEVSTKPFFASM